MKLYIFPCLLVHGCEDKLPEEGLKIDRNQNTTVVECINNGEKASYYCDGTSWIGQKPNCSVEQEQTVIEGEANEHQGIEYWYYTTPPFYSSYEFAWAQRLI